MNFEIVGEHDNGGVIRATLKLHCGRDGKAANCCTLPLRVGAAEDQRASRGPHIWGWNGKHGAEASITPSINCTEPGCGFHKTLTAGKWQ